MKNSKPDNQDLDDDLDDILDDILDDDLDDMLDGEIISKTIKKVLKQNKNKHSIKIAYINLAWVISILIGIIILLIAKEFGTNNNMINLISISSGLISIVLAIVAIAIALKQESDSSNINNYMIRQLAELDKSIANLDVAISSMKELSNLKIDNLSSQLSESLNIKDTIDKDQIRVIVRNELRKQSTENKTKKEHEMDEGQRRALIKIMKMAEKRYKDMETPQSDSNNT